MASSNQPNILYYSIPNGTLIPLLDANGQYVPASAFPNAIPVNIIATLEPTTPQADTTTAGQPGAMATTAVAQQGATAANQPAPQQQQQPPACVIMFLQRDGTYGLRPDSVSVSLSLGIFYGG